MPQDNAVKFQLVDRPSKTAFDNVIRTGFVDPLPGNNRFVIGVLADEVMAVQEGAFPDKKYDLKSRLNEFWGHVGNLPEFKTHKRLEVYAMDADNLGKMKAGLHYEYIELAGKTKEERAALREERRADRVPSKADSTPELTALTKRLEAAGVL